MNISMAANVVLLIVKIVASAYSGSLAVVASTVDSVMDLVSGGIVYVSAMMAARRDVHSFPIGKSRYEPLGVIVFAALMAAASLQLISQGAMQLSKGLGSGAAGSEAATAAAEDLKGERGNVTFAVLACVILVKGALFVWCRSLRFLSSSVGALALDHFNDVVTNLLPLFAVLITSNFPPYWWVDPAIAVLMSIYMVSIWTEAAREQISLIAGRAATPREIAEVTFLALTHSASVLAVDTVLCYQLGNKLQAEVDIVLPEDTPLRESHDVGELLQFRVEALLNIERCFVHLDYEWQHSKDDEHYNPYLQPNYAPGED
jgi:cation diffusion facilitator family transporter